MEGRGGGGGGGGGGCSSCTAGGAQKVPVISGEFETSPLPFSDFPGS